MRPEPLGQRTGRFVHPSSVRVLLAGAGSRQGGFGRIAARLERRQLDRAQIGGREPKGIVTNASFLRNPGKLMRRAEMPLQQRKRVWPFVVGWFRRGRLTPTRVTAVW